MHGNSQRRLRAQARFPGGEGSICGNMDGCGSLMEIYGAKVQNFGIDSRHIAVDRCLSVGAAFCQIR